MKAMHLSEQDVADLRELAKNWLELVAENQPLLRWPGSGLPDNRHMDLSCEEARRFLSIECALRSTSPTHRTRRRAA